MRLPQDIANLLAVAIRDVIWFKQKVLAFLEECGVPPAVMVEAHRLDRDKTPTIKIVQHVLDRLAGKGDEGAQVLRTMLTRVYSWKDLHTLPDDRKDQAVESLRAFHQGFDLYERQRKCEEKRPSQAEHAGRGAISLSDQVTLHAFRDEFDGIHATQDPQERGTRFQNLMNRIFDHFAEESRGPFSRTGEQIEGLFYFDGHQYCVKACWKAETANAADVTALRDRAKGVPGGDTKALFISLDGFDPDCIESLRAEPDEGLILMDGYDLRCVLDCQIAFEVLLAEKQLALIRDRKPFAGAHDIIRQRKGAR